MIRFVFNAFDEDHSGYIDFEEFVTALSVTSRGKVEEKLDCTFFYRSDGSIMVINPHYLNSSITIEFII